MECVPTSDHVPFPWVEESSRCIYIPLSCCVQRLNKETVLEGRTHGENQYHPFRNIKCIAYTKLLLLSRKEAEKEEKVTRWRDWKEKLDDLVSRLKSKLDRAKTSDSPKDRKAIEDQREDVQVCDRRIT